MTSKSTNPRLYWILQIIGWILYGTIGAVTVGSYAGRNVQFKVSVMAFVGAAVLLVFTHLFRNYIKKHKWTSLSFGAIVWRLFFATLFLATLSQLIASVNLVYVFKVMGDQTYRFKVLLLYIFQTQVILIVWSLIYFSYHFFKNYKSEEVEKWKLQAAVKDAELIALKAQINPHFLFNCLNNIKSLVLENAEKSREMISRLSDMLRYSVRYNNAELVTLEEELSVVKDYLALESIQLEERLQCTVELDSEVRLAKVPHMAVQLLVENAIKHAISVLPKGGEICVTARKKNDALRIRVSNTGQLNSNTSAGSGIGLKNIRERLELLFGKEGKLTLENRDDKNVLATINLPIKS